MKLKWALRGTSRGGRVQVVCLARAAEQPSYAGRHRNKRTRPKASEKEREREALSPVLLLLWVSVSPTRVEMFMLVHFNPSVVEAS